MPTTDTAKISTPCDMSVGHFARECQAFNMLGLVVRHVHAPTSDADFQAEEAQQLSNALIGLRSILVREELERGVYCSAFALCSR